MAGRNGARVGPARWLRPREWSALGAGLALGGLAGAALGHPEPGWVSWALACAVVGASSAGACVTGCRLGVGAATVGLAAGGVAGLEGLLLARLALRGDAEMVDSLIGTTVLAIVLGLLCAAVAGLLLSGDQDATEGAG